jgi:hypothetical protein
VYDAGKETFTKEHLKTIPRISVENAFKETTLIKSDLAYEQRGFISVSAFGFAACRGSSPLVPYNNSQRVMKAQAGMQMDWDAVRNVNDNGLVQTAKIFDPTGISSYPDVYYAYKDIAGRVRYKFGT